MKKRQYFVVIVMLLVMISIYIDKVYGSDILDTSDKSLDYSVNSIYTNNVIYVSGIEKQYPPITSSEQSYGLTGYKYINYQLQDINPESVTKVYNTFYINDLEPQTEYDIKVSFSGRTNNNVSTALELTYSQNQIDYALNSDTNKYSVALQNQNTDNNLVKYYLFNNNSFYEGNITGVTNSNGSLYVVLAVSSENTDQYSYNLNGLEMHFYERGSVTEDEDINLQQVGEDVYETETDE